MTDPVTGLSIPDTGYFESGAYVVTNWVRAQVTSDVIVATDVPPNPRPARLIVVHGAPTSGGENIVLSKRRLIINTYDLTESLSVRMAEMVRGYLISGMYTRGSGFRRVVIVGEPYYFPDPDDPAETPRAQLTADITVRARFKPYGS